MQDLRLSPPQSDQLPIEFVLTTPAMISHTLRAAPAMRASSPINIGLKASVMVNTRAYSKKHAKRAFISPLPKCCHFCSIKTATTWSVKTSAWFCSTANSSTHRRLFTSPSAVNSSLAFVESSGVAINLPTCRVNVPAGLCFKIDFDGVRLL